MRYADSLSGSPCTLGSDMKELSSRTGGRSVRRTADRCAICSHRQSHPHQISAPRCFHVFIPIRTVRSDRGQTERDGSRGPRESTIGFFSVKSGPGREAPLAEHYALASYCHSKHEEDGMQFMSAHQHFPYLKAKWAGANEIARSVRRERDPMAMKRMTGKSKLTINEGEWSKARLDLMRKAITAKFRVRERLLATGDAHLEERNGGEEPEATARS